jgi:hypothetical protein
MHTPLFCRAYVGGDEKGAYAGPGSTNHNHHEKTTQKRMKEPPPYRDDNAMRDPKNSL